MTDYAVVYISIGNSDDKLTQAEWAKFYSEVSRAVHAAAEADPIAAVVGQWVSEPASAWQNACWALVLPVQIPVIRGLRERLETLAKRYRQDSIAWAVAPTTEFVRPGGDRS